MKKRTHLLSSAVALCMTMLAANAQAQNLRTIVNDAPIEMIEVKGGTFMMGDQTRQNKDALPLHRITLNSYYVGRTEVTQKLWTAVMGYNNSHFKGDYRPVENIDYEEIQTFLKKLNEATGINFRLLTEAEWEFAARGGLQTKGYVYSGSNKLDEVGWTGDSNPTHTTHNVANKQPNELGIYDMTGNVWEWCSDYNGPYSDKDQKNPKGPTKATWHQARGGGYSHFSYWCQLAYRDLQYPSGKGDGLGFRLAMDATKGNTRLMEVAKEWYLTKDVVTEAAPRAAKVEEKDIVANPSREMLVGVWQRFVLDNANERKYGPILKILAADGSFQNVSPVRVNNPKFGFGGTGTWAVEDGCLVETVAAKSGNIFNGKKNAMELILSDNGKVMHIIWLNPITGAKMDEYYERVE